MKKPKAKRTFKPGDAISIAVGAEHIRDSDPCNKDNCMLSRAFIAWLIAVYGGKAADYKVKSTNHGITFELDGRRYVAVFDTKTAARIYKYDRTFKETRNKEKARSTVRPFPARVMVEASTAATRWESRPMSEEAKKRLRALPAKAKDAVYKPRPSSAARDLSM